MSGWIGAWGNAATVTNLTVTGSEVISVNTSTNALRITQTGTGNALVVEDSANPDSTPTVIDAIGTVIAGNTVALNAVNPANGSVMAPVIQSHATNSVAQASYGATSWFSSAVQTSALILAKCNSGTVGTHTGGSVASGTLLGQVSFQGSDGTAFVRAADITATVDGTPGTNDMPGRLTFSTTADGASSPTERMRIDNSGNVYGTAGTTGMTGGFFYIPSAAGAPSGVPTVISGRVPMYYDNTNNNFYVYNGAWKKVLLG